MIKNSTINAAWHRQHRMPKNATDDQRIEWHLEHLKNCHCRSVIPAKLKAEMKQRNIPLPFIEPAG
jgi:hypothetical protein